MTPVSSGIIGVAGRRQGEPGVDHPYFEWSALPARPALTWPESKPAALAVILDLGAVEWERAGAPVVPPQGGRGVRTHPDFPRMSHREYGHRAGVFRLLDVLGELGIPVAAAVDVLTAQAYPAVMNRLLEADAEIIAHGLSASRPITSLMSEDEEVDYIGTTVERLATATGRRPSGWMAPELSQSARTTRLVAEAGFDYTCDWVNDEQPFPVLGARGIWALPLSWDLSDLNVAHLRGVDPDQQANAIAEAGRVLVADGRVSGRTMTLHLMPWLAGQPFRCRALTEVLGRLASDQAWWRTTPAQIVDWCRSGGDR